MPRYLRFVRALALGSTLAGAACEEDKSAPADAGRDLVAEANPHSTTETGGETLAPIDARDAADVMDTGDVGDTSVPDIVTVDGPLPPPDLPAWA